MFLRATMNQLGRAEITFYFPSTNVNFRRWWYSSFLFIDEALCCNVCDRAFQCSRQLASHQQKKRHFGWVSHKLKHKMRSNTHSIINLSQNVRAILLRIYCNNCLKNTFQSNFHNPQPFFMQPSLSHKIYSIKAERKVKLKVRRKQPCRIA